ncbi:putative Zinc finger C2H2-type [Plasmopara halstedii]
MAALVLDTDVDAASPISKTSQSSKNFVSTLKPVIKISTSKITANLNTQKVFRCTFPGCGREFQLKGNLKRHANIHNGDKKFACKFCGKTFLRKADMEVHYRVHTGEKPYRCKYETCGKCFARRSDLLSHERTHTGKKPFACAFPGCDRSFARKFDLHKHQRLHSNQRDARKSKTKKRKLEPMKLDSENKHCDCPSDVTMSIIGTTINPDVLLPETPVRDAQPNTTYSTSRRKSSATACIDTPSRSLCYEIKCPEKHIHSPPACLAALSSVDAFLLSQETLPFTLDALPPHCPLTTIGTSCCPAHLELRPPPPDENTVSNGSKLIGSMLLSQMLTPDSTVGSTPNQRRETIITPSVLTDVPAPNQQTNTAVLVSVENTISIPVEGEELLSVKCSSDISQEESSTTYVEDTTNGLTATVALKGAAGKLCLPTPTSSLLDYSLHNRSCGHLSIQHGNHRDYVVQNHLVCQDSVKRLGTNHRNPAATTVSALEPASCTLPKDTHRPGCGHLPVRHNDHIDYVVEDNLICQQASWLEDDNLELLGDDFWDFYGAIDAFPTM